MNVQIFKLDLKKAEEPEITLPTSAGSQKKQGDYGKISTSASLTMKESEQAGLFSWAPKSLQMVIAAMKISCKDGHNKGQKWYGPKRSKRYLEEVARIHRTTQKRFHDPDNHDGVITHR